MVVVVLGKVVRQDLAVEAVDRMEVVRAIVARGHALARDGTVVVDEERASARVDGEGLLRSGPQGEALRSRVGTGVRAEAEAARRCGLAGRGRRDEDPLRRRPFYHDHLGRGAPRRPRPVDRDESERRACVDVGVGGKGDGDAERLLGRRHNEDGAGGRLGPDGRGGLRVGSGLPGLLGVYLRGCRAALRRRRGRSRARPRAGAARRHACGERRQDERLHSPHPAPPSPAVESHLSGRGTIIQPGSGGSTAVESVAPPG
ncbi:MAG: hypothetical protein ACYTKD_15010 [Planctomycetota bacterium]